MKFEFPVALIHQYRASITIRKLPNRQISLSQAQPKVTEAAPVNANQHLQVVY